MTNEWEEFKAYTDAPEFRLTTTGSTKFLGRFTSDIIDYNYGFDRIFSILSRGILFHNADGSLRDGDPYERTDAARRFLCAWCSIPEKTGSTKDKPEWKYSCSFPAYHEEFPDTVNGNGEGWYCRYLRSLSSFISDNLENGTGETRVSKKLAKYADKDNLTKLEDKWRKNVVKWQMSMYNRNMKMDFPTLFDCSIADALTLGPLRKEKITLDGETEAWINSFPKTTPKTREAMTAVTEFYIANKQPDSDWVMLPQKNMDAYLGGTTFSHNGLGRLPEGFLYSKGECNGVSCICVLLPKNSST